MSVLDMLTGMRLKASHIDGDSASFQFEECLLIAYNTVQVFGRESELVGASVVRVELEAGNCLRVVLDIGASFEIDMRPASYTGPEALSARFSNGTIVVV